MSNLRIDRRFTVTQDPSMSECFQACVATIFQVPPEQLPTMGADVPSDQDLDGLEQDQELQSWLRKHGIDFLRIPASRDENGVRTLPWGVCIASGPTNRGTHHAVVWDAGWWKEPERAEDTRSDGHMLHDPHPSRDGLEEINYFSCFVVREPLRLENF